MSKINLDYSTSEGYCLLAGDGCSADEMGKCDTCDIAQDYQKAKKEGRV